MARAKLVGSITSPDGVVWRVLRRSCCQYTLVAPGHRRVLYNPEHVYERVFGGSVGGVRVTLGQDGVWARS